MMKVYLYLVICLVYSPAILAQLCAFDTIQSSHLSGQYLDNKDGTVTDIVNSIQWQKCSVGQLFNTDTQSCDGTPTHFATWKEALVRSAAESDTLNDEKWRLPNIKELASLVERACFDPAISLTAFPSTPSTVYWSNTPNIHNTHLSVEGLVIDMKDGTEFIKSVTVFHFIRLVKSI